jgi:CubicO group peptidase (beta-lactamase class C family)
MKRFAIALWCGLACGAPAVGAAAANAAVQSVPVQSDAAARAERVEAGLLPPVVLAGRAMGMTLAERMAHHRVPGLSLAVIHEGKIEWARGYGLREKDGKQPVTTQTRFLAGSISKPVAALVALRLVEQGKLELDADVNSKLRSWKVPENELTHEHKVNLRGLLSHSAGLGVHGFPGYESGARVPTLVQILNGEAPANTAAIRVESVPGSEWRYSGGGYVVLQQLLSDVTGKAFPDLARELVLAPLRMEHSGYENPPTPACAAAAARAHRSGGAQVPGGWHVYPEMAAAGLWTTASDLARYAIEMQRALAGESAILSRGMALQMLSVQKGESGLGLSLKNAGTDAASFSHSGVDEGFDAFFIAYNQSGRGAVLLMNANGAMPLAGEILRSIAREYGWPDFVPHERAVAEVDPRVYADYVGEYEMQPGETLSVSTAEGRLYLEPSGQTREELFPESETTYFPTASPDLRISFLRDPDGTVTGMAVHQGRGTATAEKLR